MGLGQPGMQRHQTGLHAEAEEDQPERHAGPNRRQLGGTHGREGEAVAEGGQHAEPEQDAQAADMGHQQIEKGRASVGRLLVLKGDQEVGRQRHDLPGDHEEKGVVGQDDQEHPGQEEPGEAAERNQRIPALLEPAHIGRSVEPDRAGHQTDQEQEEAGECIDTHMPGQPRQTQGQGRGRRAVRQQGTQPGQDRRHAAEPGQRHRREAHHLGESRRQQRDGGRPEGERHRESGDRQGSLDPHGIASGPLTAEAVCLSRTPRPPPALT